MAELSRAAMWSLHGPRRVWARHRVEPGVLGLVAVYGMHSCACPPLSNTTTAKRKRGFYFEVPFIQIWLYWKTKLSTHQILRSLLVFGCKISMILPYSQETLSVWEVQPTGNASLNARITMYSNRRQQCLCNAHVNKQAWVPPMCIHSFFEVLYGGCCFNESP